MKLAKQPKSIELYIKKIKLMNRETIDKYQRRWVWLIKHHQEADSPLSQTIAIVIEQTISSALTGRIKPSTFRSYKAAICFGLAKCYLQLDDVDPSSEFLDDNFTKTFISDLYKKVIDVHIANNKNIKYELKTSAHKMKLFPQQFYVYLMGLYKDGNNELGQRFNQLCVFVTANLIIGIRPIEWLDISFCCNIQTKTIITFVANGKNSQGRANGDIRELHLHDIKDADVNNLLLFQIILEDELSEIENHDKAKQLDSHYDQKEPTYDFDGFLGSPISKVSYTNNHSKRKSYGERFYRSLQNEMYRVFQLFLAETNFSYEGHLVSLYSTRHQCIANAKSSEASKFQIAAFFGHSSIHTSTRHYGKSWNGWSKFNYRPSLESIAHVNGGFKYLNALSATNALPEHKNDIRKLKTTFGFNDHSGE